MITNSLVLVLLAAPFIRSAEISCVGTVGTCPSGFCFDRISVNSNTVESACSKDGFCSVSGCEVKGGKFVCCCSGNSCNGQSSSDLKARLEQFKAAQAPADGVHPVRPKTQRALREEDEETENPAAAPLALKPPAPSTEMPLVRPETTPTVPPTPAAANTVPVVVQTTTEAPTTSTTTQAPTTPVPVTTAAPVVTTQAPTQAAVPVTTTEEDPETTVDTRVEVPVATESEELTTEEPTEAVVVTEAPTTTTSTAAPSTTTTSTTTTTTTTTTEKPTTTQAPTTQAPTTQRPTTTTTAAPETTTILMLRAPDMPKKELDTPRPTESEKDKVKTAEIAPLIPLWCCVLIGTFIALFFIVVTVLCIRARKMRKRSSAETSSSAHVEQARPLVQPASPHNA